MGVDLTQSPVYVYALLERGTRPVRAAGRTIEVLDAGGVYAAVRRTSERPALSETALREQHAIVCRLAGRFDSLLPARFGTWVPFAELQQVVESRRTVIQDALRLVRGRQQMTLRLDAAAAAAPASEPARSGAEYLRARQATAMAELPASIGRPIDEATRGIVAAAKVERKKRGVAIYHLVDRDRAGQYRTAIEDLTRNLDLGSIQVSGPWPAFAFAPDLW